MGFYVTGGGGAVVSARHCGAAEALKEAPHKQRGIVDCAATRPRSSQRKDRVVAVPGRDLGQPGCYEGERVFPGGFFECTRTPVPGTHQRLLHPVGRIGHPRHLEAAEAAGHVRVPQRIVRDLDHASAFDVGQKGASGAAITITGYRYCHDLSLYSFPADWGPAVRFPTELCGSAHGFPARAPLLFPPTSPENNPLPPAPSRSSSGDIGPGRDHSRRTGR